MGPEIRMFGVGLDIPHFPVLSLPVRVIGWQTAPVTWSRFAVAAMTSR